MASGLPGTNTREHASPKCREGKGGGNEEVVSGCMIEVRVGYSVRC